MFKKAPNPNGSKPEYDGPIIKVSGLTKKYVTAGGEILALDNVNLTIQPGEFVVVTGKSGAGKTTLVNMIAALDHHTAGEIWVAGHPVHNLGMERSARWRGRNIGVVFQTFELLPTLTVQQNIMLPMDLARRFPIRQQRKRSMMLLEQVGIAEHARKPPTAVSGGQQQRIAIARAMANDPPILVADEPTGSLDSTTASAVLDVFEALAAQGKTIFLVTHDQDIAQRADHLITLADGKVIAERN
jgi:putative ABC transport system ATP-binding protein